MKFTKNNIAKLALSAGKDDEIHFDDEVKGFGLRLRAGGKWIIQYRIGSKQRRLVLGDVAKIDADAARKAAKRKLAAVALGQDPQADKLAARAKDATTLGSVVELYLTAKEPELRPKSIAESRRYLRISWKPLHDLPVHAITRRDVAARITKITAENGPVPAARARAYMSALMAWSMREGLCDANPVIGSNRPPEPKPRDRVLSDAELAAIWSACKNDDFGRIVKLLTLTGCRRDEIGDLRWEEIDLDRAVIVLPGERTKNGREHEVPLADLALDVLAMCSRRSGRELVFGEGEGGFGGYGKAKLMLDKRAGALEGGPWRIHDLRRTCATAMADKLDVLPHIIEAVLGHVSGHKAGVAGVYNHAKYLPQTRAALGLWADYVRTVVDGGARKLVPLKKPA
jgi:integrase